MYSIPLNRTVQPVIVPAFLVVVAVDGGGDWKKDALKCDGSQTWDLNGFFSLPLWGVFVVVTHDSGSNISPVPVRKNELKRGGFIYIVK